MLKIDERVAKVLFIVLATQIAGTPAFCVEKKGGQQLKTPSTLCKTTVSEFANPSSKKLLDRNAFVTDRDFQEYVEYLHPDFLADLRNLRSNDILMDGGAGQAIFLRQYAFQENISVNRKEVKLPPLHQRARTLAIARAKPVMKTKDFDPRTGTATCLPKEGARFDYVTGDLAELPTARPQLVGKISRIVDFRGVIQYSHFEKALSTYLRMLRVGGKIYFSDPEVSIFRNETEVPLDLYLKNTKGIKFKARPNPGYPNDRINALKQGSFVIEKISKNFELPSLILQSSGIDSSVGGYASYEWIQSQ